MKPNASDGSPFLAALETLRFVEQARAGRVGEGRSRGSQSADGGLVPSAGGKVHRFRIGREGAPEPSGPVIAAFLVLKSAPASRGQDPHALEDRTQALRAGVSAARFTVGWLPATGVATEARASPKPPTPPASDPAGSDRCPRVDGRVLGRRRPENRRR
jgi:hypothetical protein